MHRSIVFTVALFAIAPLARAQTSPSVRIDRYAAAGYQLVNGQLKNQDWVSPTLNTTADGALYFNVLDLAKWDAALYGERLLKKSSLDDHLTVVTLMNLGGVDPKPIAHAIAGLYSPALAHDAAR